jgi:hypothetical protein
MLKVFFILYISPMEIKEKFKKENNFFKTLYMTYNRQDDIGSHLEVRGLSLDHSISKYFEVVIFPWRE